MPDRPANPVELRDSLGIRPFAPPWRVAIKALYGVPLERDERPLFRQIAGHAEERPGEGWPEFLAIVGRGGGKDDTIKTVVNFECVFGGHEVAAAPGQRLPALVICPLLNQARGMLRMIRGEAELPALRWHVSNVTRDAVEFRNGTVAQVQTCDAVAVTGDTVIVAVPNEWAQFPGPDSVTPDTVIDQNLRPSLRSVEGSPPHRHIAITSAYTRDSLAYRTYEANFGDPNAHVLTVVGPTTLFNPNVDRAWLARERKQMGEAAYSMHFECMWRDALQGNWFGDEAMAKSFDANRTGWPPPDPEHHRRLSYVIGLDQAFNNDRFALAHAHAEMGDGGPIAIVGGVKVWSPPRGREALDVDEVVAEISEHARLYRATVLADQFSFEPLAALFRRQGVHLRDRAWTATTKAPRYRLVRDAMLAGRVRLPDDPELRREFAGIAGKLLRSGGEQIEAARGHDDRVSAVVMACAEVLSNAAHWGSADFRSSTGGRRESGWAVGTTGRLEPYVDDRSGTVRLRHTGRRPSGHSGGF